MNKKLLGVLGIAALLLAGNFAWQEVKEVDAAESATVTQLNALITKYYNEGVYTKNTSINVTEAARNEITENGGFHNSANSLIRTTYFDGNELWMTNDSGVNSGYGTDQNGNMTHFKKVDGENKVDYTVAMENGGGMEEFYITMKDVIATDEQSWTLTDGVYLSSNENVVEWFKAICAPCYVGFETATSNYITLTKVSIEEADGALQLKLYASEGDKTKLNDDNLVFAQATILQGHISNVTISVEDGLIESDRSVWAWTWSTDIDGAERWIKATEYDVTNNTAKFTLDIATYDNIKVVGCHADTKNPVWNAHPFAAPGTIFSKAEDTKINLGANIYNVKIEENFDCPYSVGLVGSATSWGNDYDIEFVCTSGNSNNVWVFEGEWTFKANEEFKMRLNGEWTHSFGNESNDNVKCSEAGTYKVTIKLNWHDDWDNKLWGTQIILDKNN